MELIEQVLNRQNMMRAYNQVKRNKGAAGVDGMSVSELYTYLTDNRKSIEAALRNGTYLPQPIRGVEIPKSNGKMRLLGIPTVVDRLLQQAVGQVLANRFELEFEDFSYGFRPNRNAQQAVLKAQEYINSGLQDIVDIDLKAFFDEVDHCILLQLLYRRVKCPLTLRLIRKWLRAPILINGKLTKRRKGVPQGSGLSPLLSNIMLSIPVHPIFGGRKISFFRSIPVRGLTLFIFRSIPVHSNVPSYLCSFKITQQSKGKMAGKPASMSKIKQVLQLSEKFSKIHIQVFVQQFDKKLFFSNSNTWFIV